MPGGKARVLVGSPVRKSAEILRYFLTGLQGLRAETVELSFVFIDDNEDEESSRLLQHFAKDFPTQILSSNDAVPMPDLGDGTTRTWNLELTWKLGRMRDRIIEHTLQEGYDALFLVDADVVVRPGTVERLRRAQKPIISNIFWTEFVRGQGKLPQVWMQDSYTLHRERRPLPYAEEQAQRWAFVRRLQVPGVYEVGGLGACTLIDVAPLRAGVRCKEIRNISFWGEDRHFCIRAMALGFSLHVDTHEPVYHIYRDEDLPGAEKFLREALEEDLVADQNLEDPQGIAKFIMKALEEASVASEELAEVAEVPGSDQDKVLAGAPEETDTGADRGFHAYTGQKVEQTPRVLVASAIHHPLKMFRYMLQGLRGLQSDAHELSFLFAGPGANPSGETETAPDIQQELDAFAGEFPTTLWPFPTSHGFSYEYADFTHYWWLETTWQLAQMKDEIIAYTLKCGYDALFLLESNVVVHPKSFVSLWKAEKPIVGNIIWTKFYPDKDKLPHAWCQDYYTLHPIRPPVKDKARAMRLESEFQDQLRKPGVYEVGSCATCMLIRREALEAGARFAEIENISCWGEDRHFCIRAAALDRLGSVRPLLP